MTDKSKENVMENILTMRGLNKHYGSLHAVKDLSFTVKRGEIFGILGPNGSGKTTTLECILGTRSRDSGSISLLGMDPVVQRRDVFTKVGVQFQDSAWQPSITVQEICESTACLYRPVPDWEPMLTDFDLAKRRKHAAESLSIGICAVGLMGLPLVLAEYRHRKVLILAVIATAGILLSLASFRWDME